MVPILSPAHQDCICPDCFHNSRKREWDPSLTSCPKPFSSLVCQAKNIPHSYRHRVSVCLNWCITSAHLGMILSHSVSQPGPGQKSRKSLSLPEILHCWTSWSSKVISVTHEKSTSSPSTEKEKIHFRGHFSWALILTWDITYAQTFYLTPYYTFMGYCLSGVDHTKL